MSKLVSSARLLTRAARFDWRRALLYAVPTAAVGVIVVWTLFAAGTPIAFEAESGSLASPAKNVTTTGASGGSAIQFGAAATPTPTPSAGNPCGRTSTVPATYKHVIWIWEENKSYAEVIGNASAPYETNLVSQCATASNYNDILHPSSGNYIGGTAGQIPSNLTGDPLPSASASTTIDNLFRQVRTAGGRALSYEESMTSNCEMTNSADMQYQTKHNPQVYYWNSGDLAACQTDNVPMGTTTGGAFHDALASDAALPAFSFVTPNICNDMHDCSVSTGDAWLANWLPVIFASPAYQSGDTAVFVMWDESDTSNSSSIQPSIFIAPSVTAGTAISQSINHYNVLRTTEEMLGISSYLSAAGSASSLRSSLHL